jgi:CRP/FNR family transcriptional regulator, cyclic AMP receptor protein
MRSSRGTQAGRPDERTIEELSPQDGNACSQGFVPRLATLLLEKAENGVVAGVTHKELAEHLGLHRESITATLGELRRAGIITIQRKTISIQQAIQGYRKQVPPVTPGSV